MTDEEKDILYGELMQVFGCTFYPYSMDDVRGEVEGLLDKYKPESLKE